MQKTVNRGCVAGGSNSLLTTPVLGIDRGRVSFPADLTC